MSATTTIRLPPELRARLQALSEQTGRSAHSLIIEAVEKHADYEERLQALVREAIATEKRIEESGEVYRAEDVHAWMQRLAKGERPARPKACRK